MVKISRFEIENVKRVQAVELTPSPSGLTVIGGRNRQGKTSVLDAICWALGGARYKPSEPKRDGSMADPRVQIELDNGLVVTRDGKNGTLKVLDPAGNKAGQAILDELIGQLALDLPKFLQADAKKKAEYLLQTIGVAGELSALDAKIQQIYNERHAVGQVALRKKKHAEDLPFDAAAPDVEVSAGELVQRQQAIFNNNARNQELRSRFASLEQDVAAQEDKAEALRKQVEEAESYLAVLEGALGQAAEAAEQAVDLPMDEVQASIQEIDAVNQRVRANAARQQALSEASELREQVDSLTEQLDSTRSQRQALLDGANLPLPGLSIDDGELTYLNKKWDCVSSAEQLRVAVAIARSFRPTCKFVLLDKLEQMDLDTLKDFGAWLTAEGLQVISTRVSTGDECSILIEDGMVLEPVCSGPLAPAVIPDDEEGF